MKKCLLICLVLALLLVGCGSKEGDVVEDPDITVDQILWELGEGELEGDNYMLCRFTNNSRYKVTSLRLSFAGKQELTEDEIDAFYEAVRESQGFGKEFMENFRQEREKKGLSISMYAQADGEIAAGKTTEPVKCYYFGGFTSKNMIYAELFAPENLQITYVKAGKAYSVSYEFATGEYTVAQLQED